MVNLDVTGTLSAPNTQLGRSAINPGSSLIVDPTVVSNGTVDCPSPQVLVGLTISTDASGDITFEIRCANATLP